MILAKSVSDMVLTQFLVGCKLARLGFQHNRNAIAHRVGKTAGFTHQFLLFLVVLQGGFAYRAYQYAQQFLVYHASAHQGSNQGA